MASHHPILNRAIVIQYVLMNGIIVLKEYVRRGKVKDPVENKHLIHHNDLYKLMTV
jgi:hypothetical protein